MRRRLGSGRMLAGGVLLATVAAGCGGSPAGVEPAPVVTPSPAPAVTPMPGADRADAVVRAFGALIGKQDLTFHGVERISTTGGGVKLDVTLDVAGTDLAFVLDLPGARDLELRHVGGATFARLGSGRWRAASSDERLLDELADPFLYLCWLDDLAYRGPATDPAGAFAFTCPKAFAYQTPLMRANGQTGRIESLDLVLLEDGTPVSMSLSGSGPTLATSSETFRIELAFSRVGEPIVIKLPKG